LYLPIKGLYKKVKRERSDTKQNGRFVTSTNLTGSQNPPAIPGTGTGIGGFGHKHIGEPGLSVSGISPPINSMEPKVTGNKHSQHISPIGSTNLPVHFASAFLQLLNKIIAKHIAITGTFIIFIV